MSETIGRIIGKFQGYEKYSFKTIYKIKEIESDRLPKTYRIECTKKFLEPPYYTIKDITTITEDGNIINVTLILPEDELSYKIKDLTNKGGVQNVSSNLIGGTVFFVFSRVSCALNENFSWTHIVRRDMSLNSTIQIKTMINNKTSVKNVTLRHCSDDEVITKYKVVGIENINGRRCFKVNAIETIKKYPGCANFTLTLNWGTIGLEQLYMLINPDENVENRKIVATFWVDYDKRIIVKVEGINSYGRYERVLT